MKRIKVAVTGSAGQIGYALLFRIASGQMFGTEVQIELNLLELESALPALEGVKMELEDCAFPLLSKITCTSHLSKAFKDVNWALLVGSVPRIKGMERSDLLRINGGIFQEQGKAINDFADRNCKILVVGNPCNTNAYIAKASAPQISEKNFFAMTMLDQNRAATQLAIKSNTHINSIKNIAIWGNHSSTQFPNYIQSTIDNKATIDVILDKNWLKNDFIKIVQQRGASIIEAKGSSSAASAANAIVNTVYCLTTPTPKNNYFSVVVCSDGSYGVPKGIMFSYPVISDGENWSIVKNIQLSEYEKSMIEITKNELIKERSAVSNLI